MHSVRLTRLLAAGCVAGLFGCSDASPASPTPGSPDDPPMPTGTTMAALAQATSCDDLLRKIQDDAIAKVKLASERVRTVGPDGYANGGVIAVDDADFGTAGPGSPTGGKAESAPSASPTPARDANASAGSDPLAPPQSASVPTGASDTNRQDKNVDEADFVKVVENGAHMYLLHGSSLRRLKTFPPEQTALEGEAAIIEGQPSEMFVSDAGKAVVFSTVYDGNLGKPLPAGGLVTDVACPADAKCGGGTSLLKVTQLDVRADPPRVERERYYQGNYVSSRRYTTEASDVVRVIAQSQTAYANLYAPDVDWYDAWGRKYASDVIDAQLAAWEARQVSAIRATGLTDWLPKAWEKQNGAKVEIPPACDSYYVPVAGLADYGLTQVLGLDLAQPAAAATGVTIVGATSTVYSSWSRLVLAQPDYRWSTTARDFGLLSEQRTALHAFELGGATTRYLASGWVPGQLPPNNPQFGIDVAADGTVRVATTGDVRDKPDAKPSTPEFWQQHPETRVITVRADGSQLREVGRSRDLGLPRERVQSARFVGNRAYVVTFLQTDPLVVVDVADATKPTVLGEIKIPGFSQYMHPLDDDHLITVGQSATRGIQLQLFDVSNPAAIPEPKVHDFGTGSSSEASYSHKAFTFYKGVLAVPVSGAWASQDYRYRYYSSALQLLRVDARSGFTYLGAVDHGPLYADNGAGVKCGVCDALGCYAYACGYAPEVRRGHFVEADSKTYVYSFSYAGVLVNDLSSLSPPLAKVGLPAPAFDYGFGVRSGGGSAVAPTPAVDLPAPAPLR